MLLLFTSPEHLDKFLRKPFSSYHMICYAVNSILIDSAKQNRMSFLNDTHMEELDSVQKFIEIQGWLLLTFFICLHNQLSFFNSIIVQMSKKRVHQIVKMNGCFFQ